MIFVEKQRGRSMFGHNSAMRPDAIMSKAHILRNDTQLFSAMMLHLDSVCNAWSEGLDSLFLW
jgi:hypothetical protein